MDPSNINTMPVTGIAASTAATSIQVADGSTQTMQSEENRTNQTTKPSDSSNANNKRRVAPSAHGTNRSLKGLENEILNHQLQIRILESRLGHAKECTVEQTAKLRACNNSESTREKNALRFAVECSRYQAEVIGEDLADAKRALEKAREEQEKVKGKLRKAEVEREAYKASRPKTGRPCPCDSCKEDRKRARAEMS
jgi:hypothetical protein